MFPNEARADFDVDEQAEDRLRRELNSRRPKMFDSPPPDKPTKRVERPSDGWPVGDNW
jgi:hypothetical protein